MGALDEPLNFARHLGETVAVSLVPVEFKQNGAKFVRKSGDLKEEVWFQRDRYNSLYRTQSRPSRFFLNLTSYRTIDEYNTTSTRLINPAALRYPQWWHDMPSAERDAQEFGREQREQLLAIGQSKDWWYSSEDELHQLLLVASAELLDKGIPYFDAVRLSLDSPEFRNLVREAKRTAAAWYFGSDSASLDRWAWTPR